MNGRFIRTSIVILALILTGATWAHAQAPSVQIKFKFIAGNKTLEPGAYTVDVAANGNVTLTPGAGGAALELPQIKDLGKKKVSKLELVFDEVGSVMYLSEVWMPEKDGVKVGSVDSSDRRQTVSPKSTK